MTFFWGGEGFDRLKGSKGDDYLNGGDNNDVFNGGKGADVFKLSKGIDTIVDYDLEEGDKIAIPQEYIEDFTIEPNGPDTLISIDGYGDMQLQLSGISSTTVEQNNADIFVRLS